MIRWSPRFTGPSKFARLPLVRTLDAVNLAVVGVPFDTGVTCRVGGRLGPDAVRAASVRLRFDPAAQTALVAATLAYEMLSLVAMRRTSGGRPARPRPDG